MKNEKKNYLHFSCIIPSCCCLEQLFLIKDGEERISWREGGGLGAQIMGRRSLGRCQAFVVYESTKYG